MIPLFCILCKLSTTNSNHFFGKALSRMELQTNASRLPCVFPVDSHIVKISVFTSEPTTHYYITGKSSKAIDGQEWCGYLSQWPQKEISLHTCVCLFLPASVCSSHCWVNTRISHSVMGSISSCLWLINLALALWRNVITQTRSAGVYIKAKSNSLP